MMVMFGMLKVSSLQSMPALTTEHKTKEPNTNDL